MDHKQTEYFIKELYANMEQAGYGPDDQRVHLVKELNKQAMQAEMILLGKIMQSPMAGMAFIKSVQLLLGGVNKVVLERDQAPIHISELTLATVTTAIEYFDMDIDELYKEYEEGRLFG